MMHTRQTNVDVAAKRCNNSPPKRRLEPPKLANWRPITLLNVDYKTALTVTATRLEKILVF